MLAVQLQLPCNIISKLHYTSLDTCLSASELCSHLGFKRLISAGVPSSARSTSTAATASRHASTVRGRHATFIISIEQVIGATRSAQQLRRQGCADKVNKPHLVSCTKSSTSPATTSCGGVVDATWIPWLLLWVRNCGYRAYVAESAALVVPQSSRIMCKSRVSAV